MTTRRRLLQGAGTAAAFLGLGRVLAGVDGSPTAGSRVASPFGPLAPDPDEILDLPVGFAYRVISRAGDTMDDGLYVPGAHDGMAAFPASRGRVALVCNHELRHDQRHASPFGPNDERLDRLDPALLYDPGRQRPSVGGTTTLVYHQASGTRERHFLSLAGTERNCAGGPTPWGSWLTCEETTETADRRRAQDHGWVFEVPARARQPVEPVPLRALGRFNHEAAAVDPRTGVVYLTEDEEDGLLYRFLPAQPGKLAAGGRLQALALADWRGAADTRSHDPSNRFPQQRPLAANWVDLADTHAPRTDLRHRGRADGAAVFARGEGMWFGANGVYFASTTGGAIGAGQLFRYRPSPHEGNADEIRSPGTLELFVESTDRRLLDNADNLTVTPWGDLLVCEDASTACSLMGVTPSGGLYRFAENPYTPSELAGACFSPDGRTLFVNVQARGLTLAIDGPFPDLPRAYP